MAWLAVDKDGKELISSIKPIRLTTIFYSYYRSITLPKGSIKKLIGKELTWSDEPVELTE